MLENTTDRMDSNLWKQYLEGSAVCLCDQLSDSQKIPADCFKYAFWYLQLMIVREEVFCACQKYKQTIIFL